MDNSKNGNDPIMGKKHPWYAAINACQRCGFEVSNHAEMGPASVVIDQLNLDDKVMKYLKKLDGLNLTIPVKDIANDLGLTEDAVLRILERMKLQLEELDDPV